MTFAARSGVPEPLALPAWFRESSRALLWDSAGEEGPSSCAICQEEFKSDSICRKLIPCGHIFHDECIVDWWSWRPTCPLCRRVLANSSRSTDNQANALSRAVVVIVQEVHAAATSLSSLGQ